jgi:DNA (cytosine-5)-methyltransferase 1
MLTVGSLFSGIGGLDLGLERAGMKVIWQSEIDPYCNKVLKKHWPEVPNYGNIKEIDWQQSPDPTLFAVDTLANPLAPLANDAEPTTLDTCGLGLEPPLASYDPATQSWKTSEDISLWGDYKSLESLPKSGTTRNGVLYRQPDWVRPIDETELLSWPTPKTGKCSNGGQPGSNNLADAVQMWPTQRAEKGLQKQIRASGTNVADAEGSSSGSAKPYDLCARIWQTTKLGKPNCSTRTDGDWWQVEPNVGRVANGVSARVDRLRGLGNAVVPQVAEYIGRLVMAAELNNS